MQDDVQALTQHNDAGFRLSIECRPYSVEASLGNSVRLEYLGTSVAVAGLLKFGTAAKPGKCCL